MEIQKRKIPSLSLTLDILTAHRGLQMSTLRVTEYMFQVMSVYMETTLKYLWKKCQMQME